MSSPGNKSRLLIGDDEVEIGELFKPVAERRGVAACDTDESKVAVLAETSDPDVIVSEAREEYRHGYEISLDRMI